MAVGIIAEYNPFHAGHAYQIAEIKKFSDAEIIAVMSGSFTQRGEPTILDKWTRARLAVLNGVDLVLELPFISAVRSAQDFARGGIRLLESLGVVGTLAFGAEFADLSTLKRAAAAFDEKFFATELQRLMSTGTSYAAAVTKILAQVTGLDEKILRQPNTILAIEYLRALPKKISPLLIERVGAAYDDLTLREKFSSASAIRAALHDEQVGAAYDDLTLREKFSSASAIRAALHDERVGAAYDDLTLREKFSSASAIRAALHKNSSSWEKISACVSDETLKTLREEVSAGLVDEKFLFRPLMTKLLTARVDELQKIFGMTEGLEYRLLNASSAKNFAELVNILIGRRYTASRIKRLLLYFLLDVTAAEVAELDATTCARILAFNERGRSLLKKISAPTITKLTKHLNRRDLYERRRPLEPYQKILRLDVLATDLRAILFETPRDLQSDFSTPPTFVNRLSV